MRQIYQAAEKRVEVLTGDMRLFAGRFGREGDEMLAWTYCAAPSNRSFCLGIPEPGCRGLRRYLQDSPRNVPVASDDKAIRRRRSAVLEPSKFGEFNNVVLKPESRHPQLRIYFRCPKEQPILITKCLPEQNHAFCQPGGYYVIIPSSRGTWGSSTVSEGAGMLFLPYGSAGKPLEKFLVVVGSQQANPDSQSIVWCVVENNADEQMLELDYQRHGFSVWSVFSQHRKSPSAQPFPPINRETIRLSDGSSLDMLVRKRMGVMSLHITMTLDRVQPDVDELI